MHLTFSFVLFSTFFMDSSQTSNRTFTSELIVFTLIVLFFVVPIRLFVAQPFIVNGSSMEPAFASGEYLIIDELTYRFHEPERGDVVVFHFPDDEKKFFIKRIIGLPHETVAISDHIVRITNEEHPDGFTIEEPYVDTMNIGADSVQVTLGENNYFVMGDNRNASFDSRAWGPLDNDLIVGRALLRLFPFRNIDVMPGDHEFSASSDMGGDNTK